MRAVEIGEILKRARTENALTLEEAEQQTKIRRKYLDALETGREEDIPGEVYFKGFLRSYANYLGLDGTALVEAYKQEARPLPDPGAAAAGQLAGVAATPGPGHGPKVQAVARSAGGRRGFPWLPLLILLAVGGALAVLFLLRAPASPEVPTAGQPGTGTRPAAPAPAVSPTPAAPSPAPAAAPPAPAQTPPPPTVTAGQPASDGTRPFTVSRGPIAVDLQFRDASWVRVVSDGRPVGSDSGETVARGERRQYTATRELRIRIGWTEMVDVTINGRDFGAAASESHRELVVRTAP